MLHPIVSFLSSAPVSICTVGLREPKGSVFKDDVTVS